MVFFFFCLSSNNVYLKGYIQLDKYLNAHISSVSRVRIITALTRLQPAFHSATTGLTEQDFFTSEMSFQSYLQEHDTRFPQRSSSSSFNTSDHSSVAALANQELQAIWRRTGEIHRVSPAFAALLDIPPKALESGKVGIHELMTEDSAVAYFERYAEVAFESGRGSAGMVSGCVLRDPRVGMGLGLAMMRDNDEEEMALKKKGPFSCLLTFLVKRDQWGVPVAIVGTFVPVVGCPVIGSTMVRD
jgi:PAS domain-containing protein